MFFWLIAGGMVLVVGAAIGVTLWRGTSAEGTRAERGLQVYRDQMAEVERDLARGVLSEEAAERTRTEIGRRILAMDREMQSESAARRSPGPARIAALVLVAVSFAGTVQLYRWIGQPGVPDLPLEARIEAAEDARANRMSQAEAEAVTPSEQLPVSDPRLVELVERLRNILKDRPNDAQGLRLLARNEAALGNFAAARAAQEQLVSVLGDAAEVDDLVVLADYMAIAADGRVSPQADRVLARILDADPGNGPARYYVGLMHLQTGRPDLAFAYWSRLLEEGPEDAPWIAPIRFSIRELAMIAGETRYEPPAPPSALPGPNAADMAAAQDMTPEERQEMVRGMVERLSERLATEGGTAEEWARLINALGVLGDTDRAAAIWAEAQDVFGASPEAMAMIRSAAQSAGVADGGGGAAAMPGPDAAQVEAAQDMTAEDRAAMIRGMVDRLADRLETEGGSPQEWARLINALGVLGDAERAAKAWENAQAAFSGSPEDLAVVQAAARAVGVAE